MASGSADHRSFTVEYRIEVATLKVDPGDFWFQILALLIFMPFLFGLQIVVGPLTAIPERQRFVLVGLSLLAGVVGLLHLANRFGSSKKQQEMLDRLGQLVPEFEQPWLLTENRMVEYEGVAKVPEIWIVSPDLGKNVDLHSAAFEDVVRRNIAENKTQYTYIYPGTEQTRAKVPALRQLFSGRIDALRRCPLNENVFRQLSVTHIAIYNPDMRQGADPLSACMELPVVGVPHWTRGEAAMEDLIKIQ